MVAIKISLLDADLGIPTYANPGDAGCDLRASEDAVLAPGGGRQLIATGLKIALPDGYAGFVQPRSGMALAHGVTCLNTPGLIDAGYRGEIKVLLINTDRSEPFEVRRGDKIAQLVIQEVVHGDFTLADESSLTRTERGDDGFGSTGR